MIESLHVGSLLIMIPESEEKWRWLDYANWPQGYNIFTCSTQLGMKFQLLMKHKIPQNKAFSCSKTYICCI